jgi:hypothetical protein
MNMLGVRRWTYWLVVGIVSQFQPANIFAHEISGTCVQNFLEKALVGANRAPIDEVLASSQVEKSFNNDVKIFNKNYISERDELYTAQARRMLKDGAN